MFISIVFACAVLADLAPPTCMVRIHPLPQETLADCKAWAAKINTTMVEALTPEQASALRIVDFRCIPLGDQA